MDTLTISRWARRIGSPHQDGGARRVQSTLVVGLLAVTGAWNGLAADSTAAATRSRAVRADQELAVLLTSHRAHRAPRAGSPLVVSVNAQRPITAARTALPVVGHFTGSDGVAWLRVMLPGRPNGLTGWISGQGTRKVLTSWRIVVNTSRRSVRVYRHGRLMRTFSAVVGKASTPTPEGEFFVEETERMPASEAGAPFALALSARSNVLQEFAGGPGQIAIHGRDNLGGTLGSAASHGCVRLDSASISWLAARIGPGVPVTIHR